MNIYFLGIGGIGMSALARYFNRKGWTVSGYDRSPSVVTEALESEGIAVYYSPDVRHLEGVEKMVYTPAIKEHIELDAAQAAGIPVLKRSEVLGEISRQYRTIAVAGTHGKTSTSSLLTHFLRCAGVDCTAFLGGISNNLASNFVIGDDEWVVVEADEFDRSFLTLHPEIAIINSVDADHLDIYGTHEEMLRGYRQFASQVSGEVFVHTSIAHLDWGRAVTPFGEANEAGEKVATAANLHFTGLTTEFDFRDHALGVSLNGLSLHFPGKHNVLNATAAAAVTLRVAGNSPQVLDGLRTAARSFSGIYRRFDVHLNAPNVAYIDDYAHHPAEIEAAIAATRGLFPDRKLVVVFQPHLYTRTRDFADGFADELAKADELLLLPIYPAREKPIAGVESEMIAEKAAAHNPTVRVVLKADLLTALAERISLPAVVLSLGAGDIDREVPHIKTWLETQFGA